MIDYHVHTSLCHHACGTIEDYYRAACEKGLMEIGFADHFPLEMMDYRPARPVTMAARELPYYLAKVEELRERSADPAVRLGAEVDFIPGKMKKIREVLADPRFDYLLGSVHFMGDWDFTHPQFQEEFGRCDLWKVYRDYFDLVKDACRSGLFDIAAHIDVVKKFGYRPSSDLRPLWQAVIDEVKRADMCVEVNTAGLAAPVGEIYPAPEFLRMCRRRNVPVSLGSDAHRPEDVGRNLDQAVALLKAVGYQEVATFSRRCRTMVPLE